MDVTIANLEVVEELFSGPAMESAESEDDRYVPKPQGRSDQGYRED
jgi:hypothetical protein